MSNLKDTDIDDLFRRASDKYPLRTDTADWDRMAAALDQEPPPTAGTVDGDDKRRKRRFFWLFLLLPLGGAGYFALHYAGSPGHPARAVTTATPPSTPPPSTPPSGSSASSTPATGSSASATPAADTRSTQPAMAAGKTVLQHGTGNGADLPSIAHGADQASIAHGAGAYHSSRLNNNNHNDSHSGRFQDDRIVQPDYKLGMTAAPGGQRPGGESPFGNPLENPVEDRLFYDLQRAPIPRDCQLAVNVTAPAVKKDTTAAKATPHTKHFYAGIVGAPDLSTVKMQSVKGVGSTFGLLLGYSLNKRWSIESGVYVDRKKYYTEGEYFSTKDVHLPPNVNLLNVDGVCYMWEIPVNIRYNFNPGAKTAWFATAGFSTYLMSHEKYAYGYTWYGSSRTWDSTWNIHKPSQYPFSIINLSAGFEQRLGKVGNLRVEPYIRLPLTGLGTGKLPIMSAGVNIGITRQLW